MAFGLDDAVAGVSNLLNTAINKIFPDPMQAAQAKALLEQQDFAPLAAQIAVNVQEAASASPFVAGWRPFIGWVCGFAFAYKFLVFPTVVFVAVWYDPTFNIKLLPVLDWTELSTIMMGMLGLSYHRTQEKLAK